MDGFARGRVWPRAPAKAGVWNIVEHNRNFPYLLKCAEMCPFFPDMIFSSTLLPKIESGIFVCAFFGQLSSWAVSRIKALFSATK